MLQRPAQQLKSMSHTLTCRVQMGNDQGDDKLSARASREAAGVVGNIDASKKHALTHLFVQYTTVQQYPYIFYVTY